jgi:hypothetical protein
MPDRQPADIFDFVHSQNIAHFNRLLSQVNDDALRTLLHKLIDCEHEIRRKRKDVGQDS